MKLLLAGRYRKRRRLGIGGFGVTYLGEDLGMPKDMATGRHPACVIKESKNSLRRTSEKEKELFAREASVMEVLLKQVGKHEQIPKLLAAFIENERYYIIQEYIEGTCLRDVLRGRSHRSSVAYVSMHRNRQEIDEVTVISWIKDVLEILKVIHAKGVIHRDINPNNLIVRKYDEKIVLIDFGAVKQFASAVSSISVNSEKELLKTKVGTYGYQPREQEKGECYPSSDLYALGVTMIEALLGEAPSSFFYADRSKVIWPGNKVSPKVRQFLEKLVHPLYQSRFQNANEALIALKSISRCEKYRRYTADFKNEIIRCYSTSPKKAMAFSALFLAGAGFGWGHINAGMKQYSSVVAIDGTVQKEGTVQVEEKEVEEKDREKSSIPRADEAYRSGVVKASAGKHREAIEDFDSAIEADSRFAGAYHARGKARFALEEYNQSISDFTEALTIDADYDTAYYSRGDVWKAKKDYDKAIADYSKAIDINPSYTFAYNHRGISWREKGEYDKAIADYSKAIAINPDHAYVYINRGISWREKGEYDKAIADYSKAIDINPDYAAAYSNRGNSWREKGEYDKAIADYSKAIGIDSEYAVAYKNRGNSWYEKREYDKAIDDYSKAIGIDPDYAAAYNNRGNSWEKKREYDKAIDDYSKAIGIDPDYAAAYNNRGNSWDKKREYDKAINDYSKAIDINPEYVTAYTNRGISWDKKREYSKAIDDNSKAIDISPKDADAYFNRAVSYSLQNNTSAAVRDYQIAADLYLEENDLDNHAKALSRIESIQ